MAATLLINAVKAAYAAEDRGEQSGFCFLNRPDRLPPAAFLICGNFTQGVRYVFPLRRGNNFIGRSRAQREHQLGSWQRPPLEINQWIVRCAAGVAYVADAHSTHKSFLIKADTPLSGPDALLTRNLRQAPTRVQLPENPQWADLAEGDILAGIYGWFTFAWA
jgi:hypothetical protein